MNQEKGFLWLFLFFVILSLSHSFQDFCPVGCPANCINKPISNINATVVNSTIYLDSSFTGNSTGDIDHPFTSLGDALDAIRFKNSSITIIVNPGNYTSDTLYTIDETFSGVVAHSGNSSIPAPLIITIQSSGSKEDTIFTCTGVEGLIKISPSFTNDEDPPSLTLSLVVNGIQFVNCPTSISFVGHTLDIRDSLFINTLAISASNSLYAVVVSSTDFIDSNVEFIYSEVYLQNVQFYSENQKKLTDFIYCSLSYLYLGNVLFYNAAADYVMLARRSAVEINEVTLEGVSASELLIFIDCEEVVATKIYIQEIDAPQLYDFFYFINSKLDAEEIHIKNNNNFMYALFRSQSSQLNIRNSQFINNTGVGDLNAIVFSSGPTSSVNIADSYFYNNNFHFSNVDTAASLRFQNVNFKENKFQVSVDCVGGSFCVFYNCTLKGNEIQFGVSSSTLELENVLLEGNYNQAQDGQGLFSFGDSMLTAHNVTAIDNIGHFAGVFFFGELSEVDIDSSQFIGNHGEIDAGVIYCQSCNLKISNSKFIGNHGDDKRSRGGAICITYSIITFIPPTAKISGCNFEGNVAAYGGAAFLDVLNATKPIEVTDCTFNGNNATRRGGAIYAGDFEFLPTVTNSTFQSNYALLSGQNFAGPAVSLLWVVSPNSNYTKGLSGYYLAPFSIEILDNYGERVWLSEDECMIVSASLQSTRNNKAQVLGEFQKAVLKGTAEFPSLRVVGEAGSFSFVVSSDVARFDAKIFRTEVPVIIDECNEDGKIFQPILESLYPICVDAVCPQGCLRGVCLNNNNCSCEDGWRGVKCDFRDKELYYPKYSSPEGIIFTVLTSIMIVIDLFFGVTIYIYRNTPVIKSSSPYFCMAIVFGILLAYISIYTYIGEPNQHLCSANLWLVNLAFSISFSNLLAKNWRVFRIFDNKKLRFRPVSQYELLSWISVIVGIEIIILIIWTAVDAPNQVLQITDYTESLVCGANKMPEFTRRIFISLLVYNACLLVGATWLAFKTRKVSSAFRESSTIAIAVYNTLVISVIAIPIIYLTGDTISPLGLFVIKAGAVLFVSTFGLFLLFGLKVYIVYFASHRNVLPRDKLVKGSNSYSQTGTGTVTMSKLSLANSLGESPTIYSGKLSVRGKFLQRWEEKFVEFYPTVCVLSVYQNDDKSRGGLLYDIKNCTVMPREDYLTGCFMITNSEGSVLFHADDNKSSSEWIRVINNSRKRFMNNAPEETESS